MAKSDAFMGPMIRIVLRTLLIGVKFNVDYEKQTVTIVRGDDIEVMSFVDVIKVFESIFNE